MHRAFKKLRVKPALQVCFVFVSKWDFRALIIKLGGGGQRRRPELPGSSQVSAATPASRGSAGTVGWFPGIGRGLEHRFGPCCVRVVRREGTGKSCLTHRSLVDRVLPWAQVLPGVLTPQEGQAAGSFSATSRPRYRHPVGASPGLRALSVTRGLTQGPKAAPAAGVV